MNQMSGKSALNPLGRSLYRKLLRAVAVFDKDPAYRALLWAERPQHFDRETLTWEHAPQPEFARGRAAVNAALLELNGGAWWIPNVASLPPPPKPSLPGAKKGLLGQYVESSFRTGRMPGEELDSSSPKSNTAAGLSAAFAALRVITSVRTSATAPVTEDASANESTEEEDAMEALGQVVMTKPPPNYVLPDLPAEDSGAEGIHLRQLTQGMDCTFGTTMAEADGDDEGEWESPGDGEAKPSAEGTAEPTNEEEQVTEPTGVQEVIAGGITSEGPPGGARVLVAHPLMDGFFKKTVLVLSHHRDGEAIAYVVNRQIVARVNGATPDGKPGMKLLLLRDLFPAKGGRGEFGMSKASAGVQNLAHLLRMNPVFCGGPVGMQSGDTYIRFLHTCPDVPRAMSCGGGLYVDGDPDTLVARLREGKATPHDFLVLLGYTGWTETQLSGEIQQGGWLVCQAEDAVPLAFYSQRKTVLSRKAQAEEATEEGKTEEKSEGQVESVKYVNEDMVDTATGALVFPESAWTLSLLRTEGPEGSDDAIAQLARLRRVDITKLGKV
eukprot:Hpha_TRINITY_DN14606_c0_g1::TRINITY_DN14606_c0_g1_i1::g.48043::m.48043